MDISIKIPDKGRDRLATTLSKPVTGIVLNGSFFVCTRCEKIKPGSEFGIRMVQGVVRNQAQCSSCRNVKTGAGFGVFAMRQV